MGKFVELGALVEKDAGDRAYEKIFNLDGVEYVVLETGRSNDLFASRQFGEFGEAALMTVIAELDKKDQVLDQIYEVLGIGVSSVGLIYEEKPVEKMKTYFWVGLIPGGTGDTMSEYFNAQLSRSVWQKIELIFYDKGP